MSLKMEGGRRPFIIVTGKPTGKRSLRRPKRRWVDNIRMDLEEIGVNRTNWVDWVDSTQDRDYWKALLNAVFLRLFSRL